MGITDKLNTKLAAAYNTKLADAIKPFEGSRTVSTGSYNPETGQYETEASYYRGRGVMGSFNQQEIDGARILATDTKLSGALKIETVEVVDGEPTGNLAIPQVDDVINGMTVKSVSADPADVQWVLALRRT